MFSMQVFYNPRVRFLPLLSLLNYRNSRCPSMRIGTANHQSDILLLSYAAGFVSNMTARATPKKLTR